MAERPEPPIPLYIDLSALVRRSVATLYSHLVTRPTGQALRLGIERQISELGSLCVSVLDFTQVVVLDYSCADEMVAKLLQRFQREEQDVDAYFVARAVGESHRETIEAVLERHRLSLAAELSEGGAMLLGAATAAEREAWVALDRLACAEAERVADAVGGGAGEVRGALDALVRRRVAVRRPREELYISLRSLLAPPAPG